MTTLTLKLPDALLNNLNALAAHEGKPLDEIALSALQQRVNQQERPSPSTTSFTDSEQQQARQELEDVLGALWEEQRLHPERFQTPQDTLPFGDEHEQEFARLMDDKQAEERTRWNTQP